MATIYAAYKEIYLENGQAITYADLPTKGTTYHHASDVISILFTSYSLRIALSDIGDSVVWEMTNGSAIRAIKTAETTAEIQYREKDSDTFIQWTLINIGYDSLNTCMFLITCGNELAFYTLNEGPIFVILRDPDYEHGVVGTGRFVNNSRFNAVQQPWSTNAYDAIILGNAAPDPYTPGGNSGTGGGTGTFDGTGDAISFPSLPTLSAVSTGFVSLFAPTLTQLNNLASYMWSGAFDIDLFRKLFADPMDVILGLSIVPVSVPVSGAVEVKVGNISTGITMNRASTQYVNVDCGSLQVREYWGSCLDYAPNSKCQIFLPYIGTRSLDIDEIMGKTIHVKYAVDILSGAMVANIMCGSSVLYSFTGACASSIPVVSRDFTSIISSAIQIAGNIGMAVATGGLSAPVSAASAVQLGVAAGQTAMNVANSKPSVQHSGATGGTSGMLSVQTPYLIFEIPRQSLPADYNKFGGYPANITLSLGACQGYTKIESIHLENIPATSAELDEIETLLKSGVIL